MSVQKDSFKGGAQYHKSSLHPEHTSMDCQARVETEFSFRSDDASQNAVVSSTVDIAEGQSQDNDHSLTSHGSCIRYFIRDDGHMTEEVPTGERHLGLSEILESSRLELGPADTCHDLGLSSSMPTLLFQSTLSEKDNEEVVDEETVNTITLTAEEMEKLNANHRIEILARSPGGTDQKLFFVLDEKDSPSIFSDDTHRSSEGGPLPPQTALTESYKGIPFQRSSAITSRRTETDGGSMETSGKTLNHAMASSRVGASTSAAPNPALERTAGTPADNLQKSKATHKEQIYEHDVHSSSQIPFHAHTDERLCSEQTPFFAKKHASNINTGEMIVHESRHLYETERLHIGDPPQKVIVSEHWNSRPNHHQEEETLNLEPWNVFTHTRQYAANFAESQNSAYVSRARPGSDFGAETKRAGHSSTLHQGSEDFSRTKFISSGRDSTRLELYAYPRHINSDAYYPTAETGYDYVQSEGLPLSSDDLRCQYPLLDSSRAEGNANTFTDGNGIQPFCRDEGRSRYFRDVKLLPLSHSRDSYLHTVSGENFHDAATLESAKYMYVRPMRGRGVRGQGPRARARGRRSTAGRQYLQHRLLWARYTGRSPEALSRVLQTIQDRCGIRPTNQSPSLNLDGMNQDTAVLYPVHQLEAVPAVGNCIFIGEGDHLARVAVADSSAGFVRPATVQTVLYQRQPPFNVPSSNHPSNVSSSEKGTDETYSPRYDNPVATCLEKKENEKAVPTVSMNSVSHQVPSNKQLPVDKEKVTEVNLTAAGSVRKEEIKESIILAEMTDAGDGFTCVKYVVQDDVRESEQEESPRHLAVHAQHGDDSDNHGSAGDSRTNPARCTQRSETECSPGAGNGEGSFEDGYVPPAIVPTNTPEDSLSSNIDKTVVAENKASSMEHSTSLVKNQINKNDKSDAHNLGQKLDKSAAVPTENKDNGRQDIPVDNCQFSNASSNENAAITTHVVDANLEAADSNNKENGRSVGVAVMGASEAGDKRTPQYAKDEKQEELLEIPPTPSKKLKFGNRVHFTEKNWVKGNKIINTALNDKQQREISESTCHFEQKHISKKKDGCSFHLGTTVSEALVKVVCESKVPPGSCEKKVRRNSYKNPNIQPPGVQTRKKQVRRSLFPSPGKQTRLNAEASQHVTSDHTNSMDVLRNFKQQATSLNVDTGQEITSGNGDTYPSVSQFLQAAATGGININIHVSNDASTRTPPKNSDVGKRGAGLRPMLTKKRVAVEQSTDNLAAKRPHYSENWLGQHGQNQPAPESTDLQIHTSHHSNVRNTAAFGNRYMDYGGDRFSASELKSPGYSTPDALDSYYTASYTQQYAWPVYASSQTSTSRPPTVFERPDPFSSSCTPPQQRPQYTQCHEVISDQYLLALESAVRASQELENKDTNVNLNTAKKMQRAGQDNERDFLVVETRKHRWFLGDSPLRAYPPYPGGEANSFYVSPDATHKLHNLQPYGDMYPHPIQKGNAFLDASQCNNYESGGLLGTASVHLFTHDGTYAEDPRGLQHKKCPENRSANGSYIVNAPVNLTRSNGHHWGLAYGDNQSEANRLKFWQRHTFDSSGNFTEQPSRSALSQQTSLLGKAESAYVDSRAPKNDYQSLTESNESQKKSESKGPTNT